MSLSMKFTALPILIFVFATTTNAINLEDLPDDVISDILHILISGVVDAKANCTGEKDFAPKTEYWLYTQSNPDEYIKYDVIGEIDPDKPIKFLLHGWSWDANAPHIQGIKEAYFQRYDANIIAVNWGAYAQQNYLSAYCSARGVAKNFGKFLCNLQSIGISLSDVHVVGHSMGAQISGNAGAEAKRLCGKEVGRITGLDPAGPLYTDLPRNVRLDKSDASFVDVIHTNEAQFGYAGACGDIDFYPNCGYFQNGCLEEVSKDNEDDLLGLSLDFISCNHRRSCDYFEESINSKTQFIGVPCEDCGAPICKSIPLSSKTQIMGEDCTPPTGLVTNFVLQTNSEPPYAKG